VYLYLNSSSNNHLPSPDTGDTFIKERKINMKHLNNPLAVEFEINKITYRVEPDYNSNTCEWWILGEDNKNRCELDDPAFPIMAEGEDWPLSFELYLLLSTEDTRIHGEFLRALNQAVRHFLPNGHPRWRPEVSDRYKQQQIQRER
jgi:hypothetical protein